MVALAIQATTRYDLLTIDRPRKRGLFAFGQATYFLTKIEG